MFDSAASATKKVENSGSVDTIGAALSIGADLLGGAGHIAKPSFVEFARPGIVGKTVGTTAKDEVGAGVGGITKLSASAEKGAIDVNIDVATISGKGGMMPLIITKITSSTNGTAVAANTGVEFAAEAASAVDVEAIFVVGILSFGDKEMMINGSGGRVAAFEPGFNGKFAIGEGKTVVVTDDKVVGGVANVDGSFAEHGSSGVTEDIGNITGHRHGSVAESRNISKRRTRWKVCTFIKVPKTNGVLIVGDFLVVGFEIGVGVSGASVFDTIKTTLRKLSLGLDCRRRRNNGRIDGNRISAGFIE